MRGYRSPTCNDFFDLSRTVVAGSRLVTAVSDSLIGRSEWLGIVDIVVGSTCKHVSQDTVPVSGAYGFGFVSIRYSFLSPIG